MKKIIVLLFCLILMVGSHGQTASIPDVQGEIGEVIMVPVSVEDWVKIEAITLHIQFDPLKLTYLWSELAHPDMLIHCTPTGRIGISWTDNFPWSPWTFSGVLAIIYFQVNGTSTINFVPICEVIQHPYVHVGVKYSNGLVYQSVKGQEKLN